MAAGSVRPRGSARRRRCTHPGRTAAGRTSSRAWWVALSFSAIRWPPPGESSSRTTSPGFRQGKDGRDSRRRGRTAGRVSMKATSNSRRSSAPTELLDLDHDRGPEVLPGPQVAPDVVAVARRQVGVEERPGRRAHDVLGRDEVEAARSPGLVVDDELREPAGRRPRVRSGSLTTCAVRLLAARAASTAARKARARSVRPPKSPAATALRVDEVAADGDRGGSRLDERRRRCRGRRRRSGRAGPAAAAQGRP